MKSRTRLIAGAALVVATVLAGTAGVTLASGNDHTIYRADTMAAVVAPFTGATNAIRGVPGGGAPWVISDAEIRVRASGRVDVEVEGLVIDPNFPNPAIAGKNPVPNMQVTVSCLTTAGGATTPMNVSSMSFPVDAAGNGEARLMVDLPHPCFAPIVFVANAAGNNAWFAVSGG